MSAVVVDTDVVSYLFKSHPIAFQYLPDLTDRTPMISFMTVAELATALLAGAPLITGLTLISHGQ